jgi:hypothetical protein
MNKLFVASLHINARGFLTFFEPGRHFHSFSKNPTVSILGETSKETLDCSMSLKDLFTYIFFDSWTENWGTVELLLIYIYIYILITAVI